MQHFEAVLSGHPDKIADKISDTILDDILSKDKDAKVSLEVVLSNGMCLITGQLNTKVYSPMNELTREVIKQIGYTDASYGLDYRSVGVMNVVTSQSIDLQKTTSYSKAGDTSFVYGYATNETKYYLPKGLVFVNLIAQEIDRKRKQGLLSYLRPDGKINIDIDKNIKNIVISVQHNEGVPYELLKDDIIKLVKDIDNELLLEANFIINPSYRFVLGGPSSDTGLTGRKTFADTYGSIVPLSSSLSGKDPSKIDRSGTYFARMIAKNLVKNNLCNKAKVFLSFAIGQEDAIYFDIEGDFKTDKNKIIEKIKKDIDFRVEAIIELLDLKNQKYSDICLYNHFLHSSSWEEIEFDWS